MNQLINKLKENEQDFNFYPSTSKMIKVIFDDYIKDKKDYHGLIDNFSMLDIGAGNGNVFDLFESFLPIPKDEYTSKTEIKKYAIEKSEILINNMNSDIIVVGTDFEKQTLIDKKVDLVFCNPPYSNFKEWTLKILKESNCSVVYLIIPERWKDDKEIKSIIKKREIKYKVIYSDDFLDSEYRQARAKIDIIRFDLGVTKYGKAECDPFDIWFEENFKINADKQEEYTAKYKEKDNKKDDIKELIKGKNIIECLESLYNKDMEKLLNNYKFLENLDYDIFKELNINLDNLKQGLKQKIEGLKNFYWQELFDNLNKITDKLTSKSRHQLLKKLNENTNIDFTIQNAYSIIIWVLKNANIYIDEQLKEVYFEMTEKENMIKYKSNKRFLNDDWKYISRWDLRKETHFKLDYRLVFIRHNCFSTNSWETYNYKNGLYRDIHTFINDIITIANNLGFNNIDNSYSFQWKAGQENVFYYDDKKKEFMRIRAYKNGNIHCKVNQEFMMKFNIEMARLNKWVKDETECAEELEININEVKKYFNSNQKLIKSDIKLLESNSE